MPEKAAFGLLRWARQELRHRLDTRALDRAAGKRRFQDSAFLLECVDSQVERNALPVDPQDRYGARLVAGEAALVGYVVGDAAAQKKMLDGLAVVGKELQVDVAVAPCGPAQHGPGKVGSKSLEQLHRLKRAAAKVSDALALLVALVERLIRAQLGLDLLVLRQGLRVLGAELAGRLALGESEILDAVLGHQPGGRSRDARSHLLLLRLAVFRHGKSRRTRVMIPQAESAAK